MPYLISYFCILTEATDGNIHIQTGVLIHHVERNVAVELPS